MIVLALLVLLVYVFFVGVVLENTAKGNSMYLLGFILLVLPFYTLFQLLIFKGTEAPVAVQVFRYSKDLVLFSGVALLFFGHRDTIFTRQFVLTSLDKWMIAFVAMVIVYACIPLGESSLIAKIVYAKNLFLIPLAYALGRNVVLSSVSWNRVLGLLLGIGALAAIVSVLEYVSGVHLHQVLGFGELKSVVDDIEPQGEFGLSWTFERQGGLPRFAAFFADPLEYSASLLLFLAVTIRLVFSSKTPKLKAEYTAIMALFILAFFMAYSRSAIVAATGMALFGFYITKQYRVIFSVVGAVLAVGLYVYFLSSEETRYFIEDTLTFQNSSSLGHLLEWAQGVASMIDNPQGIGLAMSGNAGGVDETIKVGGENQFLIIGVQMGVLGMLLYIVLLVKAILSGVSLFKKGTTTQHKDVGFISALVKVGLLLPLFTANAELYLFVALFSWFLVGQTQAMLNRK